VTDKNLAPRSIFSSLCAAPLERERRRGGGVFGAPCTPAPTPPHPAEGGDANLIAFNEGAAVRLSLCKNPFHKLSDCALLFYEVMRTHDEIRSAESARVNYANGIKFD
jgi:hypothetical protein